MDSQDGPPEVSTVGQLLDVAEQGRWLERDGRPLVRLNHKDIDAFQILLTRLGSRFGTRFRDPGPFRRMLCAVAEYHGRVLPCVRRLGLRAFVALLEQTPEYQSKSPAAKTKQGEGDGGKNDAKTPPKRRGHPGKKTTQKWADFAKPLVEKGLNWVEIFDQYKGRHPKDADASADKIRQAYHRTFPAK